MSQGEDKERIDVTDRNPWQRIERLVERNGQGIMELNAKIAALEERIAALEAHHEH